jgi:1-acyl-sn-glycerol-3-phosphate acyltransferase
MLRAWLAASTLILVTVTLMPIQMVALALKSQFRRRIPVIYHRIVCRLLGVRIFVIGAPPRHHPSLVIANHVSWIDISVISAVVPTVFVAKQDIADWPIFGLLAKLQQSVFVDRQRRQKTKEVNSEIAERLVGGDPVVLFAEGTSLPFRSALIGAARDVVIQAKNTSRILMQPLSIAYVGLHGIPMGRQHRHRAAWYGSTDLLPHMKRVMREGAIDVVLTWGEPIAFAAESNRKQVAKSLEANVRKLTAVALRTAPQIAGAFKPQLASPVNSIVNPLQERFGSAQLARATMERNSNI